MAMFPRIALSEIQKVEELQRRTHWATYKGLCRGQAVAILEMQQAVMPDEEESFNALFNMMCEYHNPHLVLFLGVCTEGPRWMVITEYLSNGSLDDFIDHSSATRGNANAPVPAGLSLDRKLCFAIDMCQGLAWLFRSSSASSNRGKPPTPTAHHAPTTGTTGTTTAGNSCPDSPASASACFPFLMHHHSASFLTGSLETSTSASLARGGNQSGGLKGTAMLIDHDGKCKFNFGVCLIKAKLASMAAESTATALAPIAVPTAQPSTDSTTATTTAVDPNHVPHSASSNPFHSAAPTGHHGEKEVVFCFGKIFCELLIMRRLSALGGGDEDEEEAKSTTILPESEQWLRRRITLALAHVHPVLGDVIVRCTREDRTSRPTFSELIGILQVARVDISLPATLSPLANQLWKQDEFLSSRKVKLSDLVAAIYRLLALKDIHHTGSYALSQRMDVSLLTSLLSEKGQTHASKTGSVGGGGNSHASPTKTGGNPHVHSSPNRSGAPTMKQREVLLTIGTMANLIGWFGALDAQFLERVSGVLKQRWFFGMIEGEEAHVHLQRGQFLVRMNLGANISIEKSPFTLSSVDEHGQLLHVRIFSPTGKRTGLWIKIASSAPSSESSDQLLASDTEPRKTPRTQQSTAIEGPRDITGFIQYLISIDHLKEANITTSETPFARYFNHSGSQASRKHSPYEVADGEEEESDEEKQHVSHAVANNSSDKSNQPAIVVTSENAKREQPLKQSDVCDLDLNDWIRISNGKSKSGQQATSGTNTPIHSNPRSELKSDSGSATISSSCSASDRNILTETIGEDEWVLL